MLQTMQVRQSCRTFDGEPLAKEERRALLAATDGLPAGPFGGRIRARLLEAEDAERLLQVRLGTYGVIRNAPAFLAAAIEDGPYALEDFGYAFEALVLRATALGFGTCWLGGTLRRGAFGRALELSAHEIAPAVTPVGHARGGRRTLVDAAFRYFARSDARKPWPELFFRGRFDRPMREGDAGPLAIPLAMLRRAPSASNQQPWRIVCDADGRGLHVFLRRTPDYARRLSVDLQRVDIGIGMAHLALASAELGLEGRWAVLSPPPDVGPLPENTGYVATFVRG